MHQKSCRCKRVNMNNQQPFIGFAVKKDLLTPLFINRKQLFPKELTYQLDRSHPILNNNKNLIQSKNFERYKTLKNYKATNNFSVVACSIQLTI
ncbi:CLUMA_CG014067, isoform A [Clunio marinus]|uniref:CLUMA_CG014067, isoform A n=1 Tax=Clunio marinus TaxID=568069 RepID=A0A1J1IKW8_9DIPT|nr:CLUMA_CG014067, isoform A [Clunio marinus]